MTCGARLQIAKEGERVDFCLICGALRSYFFYRADDEYDECDECDEFVFLGFDFLKSHFFRLLRRFHKVFIADFST